MFICEYFFLHESHFSCFPFITTLWIITCSFHVLLGLLFCVSAGTLRFFIFKVKAKIGRSLQFNYYKSLCEFAPVFVYMHAFTGLCIMDYDLMWPGEHFHILSVFGVIFVCVRACVCVCLLVCYWFKKISKCFIPNQRNIMSHLRVSS